MHFKMIFYYIHFITLIMVSLFELYMYYIGRDKPSTIKHHIKCKILKTYRNYNFNIIISLKHICYTWLNFFCHNTHVWDKFYEYLIGYIIQTGRHIFSILHAMQSIHQKHDNSIKFKLIVQYLISLTVYCMWPLTRYETQNHIIK